MQMLWLLCSQMLQWGARFQELAVYLVPKLTLAYNSSRRRCAFIKHKCNINSVGHLFVFMCFASMYVQQFWQLL